LVQAPAYVPAFSWTGTYVGLNVGGAWTNTDFGPTTMLNLAPNTIVGEPTVGATANSIIGGGQTGYNWQMGALVLGVEQDFQFTSLKPGFVYAAAPTLPLVTGDGFSANIKYMGATRARIGWAWDRVMLYGTGGVETAVGDGTGTYVGRAGGSPPLSFTDDRKFWIGWTVGAGLDWAMTNNVILGVDYRYFDLGTDTFNLGGVTPGAGATSTVTSTIHPRGSEVLARLNIKLNGLGFFGM
jgi:outer membrane immunogenic protein